MFILIVLDSVCKEKLHLVLLLDSSKYITLNEWNDIKQFSSEYIKQLDNESVDIDIVSVGDRVEIIDSIEDAAYMNSDRYWSDGFVMAHRLLEASQSRRVVLSVTTQRHSDVIDGKLQIVLQNLKSIDVNIKSVVLGSSGKLSDEYRVHTSKPFGNNLFKVQSSAMLKKFTTVLAQSTCRSD